MNDRCSSTLLDRLSGELLTGDRVFDVFRLDDGRFEIVDGCDQYFSVTLSAAELRQLGSELMAIADDGTKPQLAAQAWANCGGGRDDG